jgi:hypothetical protein
MLFNRSIRSRVMMVVENKLKEAQKKHDDEVHMLIDEFKKKMLQLHDEHIIDKENVANSLVDEIVGKML